MVMRLSEGVKTSKKGSVKLKVVVFQEEDL